MDFLYNTAISESIQADELLDYQKYSNVKLTSSPTKLQSIENGNFLTTVDMSVDLRFRNNS